ncbi:VOC family protein [Candidatus Xianfuyuplasma coldseepsis]|uniref:VOC domain-containing protein n=1 Tax=Candidatus Xianfuyuplasma coldseepsis TaxID=2782163 RepID=A0A7L7KPB5_9MOLU|nr:VOC family protein [Xianfuyuplasma coldseepsis]QMS84621.1 hypothetical protein G4Z02_02270 [Xianfuyuplasma coldseepsis]
MSNYHTQEVPHITHVELHVQQLQLMSNFYQQVIGLQQIEADLHHTVLGSNGVPRITLTKTNNNPLRNSAGLYHIAFLLSSLPSLSRWLHYNINRGTPIYGASDHHVSKAMYFTDPEGNGIEVYADTSDDTWYDKNHTIHMGTYPLDVDELLALDTNKWNPQEEEIQIGHLHLRAKNLDKVESFYSTLGFQKTVDLGSAKFLSYQGYHHHIAVNSWGSHRLEEYDSSQPGIASYTISMPDNIYQKLSLKGIKVNGLDTLERKPTRYITDPIGIRVYITSI